ncbi:MAG: rod-binding protein [Syntrophobacterales bacterium]|jgi:Rod binding domain-containing protein|nr:rod-binding protein [Syntrophobacterales bacterium]
MSSFTASPDMTNMISKTPLTEINKGYGKKTAEDQEKSLRKACADFESIFGYYLLKSMRAVTPSSPLLSFPGKDVYNMMLDQKIAEDLSHKGHGLGLKDMLYRQFSRSMTVNEQGTDKQFRSTGKAGLVRND